MTLYNLYLPFENQALSILKQQGFQAIAVGYPNPKPAI